MPSNIVSDRAVRPSDTEPFGGFWIGPPLGEDLSSDWAAVAFFPAEDTGKQVEVLCRAAPARFYRIRTPGLPELVTGSGPNIPVMVGMMALRLSTGRLAAYEPPEDLEEFADLSSPTYLEELFAYAMVEGGYMPPFISSRTVTEALDGTRRMLDGYIYPQHGDCYPKWFLKLCRAIRGDEAFLKALVRDVFKNGWMSGRRNLEGVELEELRDVIPQTVEERFEIYLKLYGPSK